ncbi:MAG: hypothetical protein H6686_00815 [Fibrobacteria bacterium]|nr:hypothetical protein [Fibrobacteria bacterium]
MKSSGWTVSAVLLCLVPFLAGCRRDRGAEIEDIARLFVALRQQSQAWEGQPERARQARDSLLKHAGMTLPVWRERVRLLQADPDLWVPFWNRANQIADSTENLKSTTNSKGS